MPSSHIPLRPSSDLRPRQTFTNGERERRNGICSLRAISDAQVGGRGAGSAALATGRLVHCLSCCLLNASTPVEASCLYALPAATEQDCDCTRS